MFTTFEKCLILFHVLRKRFENALFSSSLPLSEENFLFLTENDGLVWSEDPFLKLETFAKKM